MDRSVAPGDNFYDFANGTWAKATPIPADRSNFGMFNVLDDLSNDRMRGIIEEAARRPASKIGDLYASFMDEAAVEAKGFDAGEAAAGRDQGRVRHARRSPRRSAQSLREGVSGPIGASCRSGRQGSRQADRAGRRSPASACPIAIII